MRGKWKKSRFQFNSIFAQFSVVCIFNWMLGQLRVVGRSYIRGRAPNLNRLSSERKSIKSHSRPNSVFAQFSVVCMFNWMLGQLRKAVRGSFLEGRTIVCSWKSSELESAEQREGNQNLALSPIQYSRDSRSYLLDWLIDWLIVQSGWEGCWGDAEGVGRKVKKILLAI